MTRIFNIFGEEGNKLINPNTGLIVVTTGNHGDKSTRFQFEAYRILDNGQMSSETEWFLKMSFVLLES